MADTLPSAWIQRWAKLIAPSGKVLDLAAGTGRHANWLQAPGHEVTAIDRDKAALAQLSIGVEAIEADLEDGSPGRVLWPLGARQFGGIVVANYLHRPLLPRLHAALGADGILIYETFGLGNERFGRPTNPDFLLRPGELLEFCRDFALVALAYECVEIQEPRPAMVQRLAALKPRPLGLSPWAEA